MWIEPIEYIRAEQDAGDDHADDFRQVDFLADRGESQPDEKDKREGCYHR